jgi:hypothetical protein
MTPKNQEPPLTDILRDEADIRVQEIVLCDAWQAKRDPAVVFSDLLVRVDQIHNDEDVLRVDLDV